MMKRARQGGRGPRMRPDGFEPGSELNRFATLTPSSYDAQSHTVEAVLSTGARRSYFGISEELLIAPDAIDLSRVALGQVRFLDSHDQSSVDSVLGVVTGASIVNGQLVGTIRFAETERAQAAEQMVARGEVTGISIGYRVTTWAMTGVENDIEIWQAQRWELFEASLVAVPADPQAVIRSAATTGPTPANQEQDDMRRNAAAGAQPAPVIADPAAPAAGNSATITGAAAAPATRAAEPAAPAAASPAESASAERTRILGLQDIGRRAGLEETVITSAINGGSSVEQFRAVAFEQLAQRSAATTINPSHVSVTRDEQVSRRSGMVDAIVTRLARAAGERIEIPAHARAYGEMGLVEMAAEVIGHRGHVRTAAAAMDVMTRAMMTTTDFPAIFQDAINRRLLARYQTATPAFRRIFANYLATDFRPTYVVRAGDFPTLQAISQTGEIKHGTFSESKEVFQVFPFGVAFNISRQMIVNDNLNAIDQVLGSAGQRVADWENAQAMAKLAANPSLLTDTTAVFHANHNNLPTAAAIGVASVGVARAALSKQKSLDGLLLNLEPAVILTGPDKRTEAEQLVTSITPAQASNAVPESMRRIVPVSDANITGNTWYLFADPSIAPCFVYGYLDGFTGPRLTVQPQFGVQGVGVQLEHDFGTAAIDYRGGVKNTGA